MNVMGALVLTKKHPKMLGGYLKECTGCPFFSMLVEEYETKDGKKRVRVIRGDYGYCSRLGKIVPKWMGEWCRW